MPVLVLLLAASVLTVRTGGTPLRAECEGEATARLSAAAPVKIRFGINGCYAVDVVEGGVALSGYLTANEIAGIETWEQERRSAPTLRASSPGAPAAPDSGYLADALRLMAENRHSDALAAAERGLIHRPRDARLLAIAGLAALETDSPALAVGFLKDSLAIRAEAATEQALIRASRELASDRSGGLLNSPRFRFRYDHRVLSGEKARSLLTMADEEYARIASALGCNNTERIAVVAQSREDYLRSTGAAEWSGGLFDGRIRVALLEDDRSGAQTRQLLAHELVHACLAATGVWPSWLHEGLAQKLSGEQLSEPRRAAIRTAARSGVLPNLRNLPQGWSTMSAGNAAAAYAAALYAIELYFEHYREFGIRNLIRNPEQLDRIAEDLDARMRQ